MHWLFSTLFHPSPRPGWPRQVVTLLLTAALWLQSTLAAAPGPPWWSGPSQPVLDFSATPDDFAVVNVGQLKHVATQAAAAMNAPVASGGLAGGAGTAINQLVASWQAPAGAGVLRDDFQVLTLGQLKAVAALFYARLSLPPPWAGASVAQDDFRAVNAGQLKNTFAFEVAQRVVPIALGYEWTSAIYSGEALRNALAYPPIDSTSDDFNGDGISNLQAFLTGKPLFDALDYDGDRLLNSVENEHIGILDPLRFADAVEDYDGDGVMNFEELQLGLTLDDAHTKAASGLPTDKDLLLLALLHGGPLQLVTGDVVRNLWLNVDTTWLTTHGLTAASHGHWLVSTDGPDADNEEDGLTAFRTEYWAAAACISYSGDVSYDHDADGVPDFWEYRYEFALRDATDANEDADQDGLTNLTEYYQGTHPRLADSDRDGFSDGEEVQYYSNPLDAETQPPVLLTLLSSPSLSFPLSGRSAPIVVRVSQGGLPKIGSTVVFALATPSASDLGALRAEDATATVGSSLSLNTDANGYASVTFHANSHVDTTSVSITLESDPNQVATTYLTAQAAPVWNSSNISSGATMTSPYASGQAQKNDESDPAQATTLFVGQKIINAGYSKITGGDLAGSTAFGCSTLSTMADGPGYFEEYKRNTEDLTNQFVKRFKNLPIYFNSYPVNSYGRWYIPNTCFVRSYGKFDGSETNVYASEGWLQHRAITALKTGRGGKPDPTAGTLSFLVMVYQGEVGYVPIPPEENDLKTTGVIQVTSNGGTWSPSLNPYCYLKEGLLMIDPCQSGEPIEEKHNGYVDLEFFPLEITGHRRGTMSAPGAISPDGTYGKQTVLLENADHDEGNAEQRDNDTAALNQTADDDLVKVVLSFPAGTKLAGMGIKLKHEGMKVDGAKTTFDLAVVREGPSRLNFYDNQGNKLTDNDLKVDNLASPGNGYMAGLVNNGTLEIFIEGADDFGMVGTDSASQTNAKYMGGALLTLEMTGIGVPANSGPRLLVIRGGFMRYRQPVGQPGAIGTLEFRDGIGRITNDNTDLGNVLKSWDGRSGKTAGGDYDEEGDNGHIPPGWRIIYKRNDFTVSQRNKEEGTGNDMVVKQGGYCRWQQDDKAPGYTTQYLYQQKLAADRNIGKPLMPTTSSASGQTIMFKFQTEVIPPTSAANRSDIQFHPDGKKDGTAGCIGIQSYDDCKEVYRYLNDYRGLKLKVDVE